MDEPHEHPITDIKIEDEEVADMTISSHKERTPDRDRR